MTDYHKLEVWKLASELSDRVVQLVEQLGARLRPNKADQILRAADAIHENIAEGCGFNSDPQLAKYLRQARGSADETQDEPSRVVVPSRRDSRTCSRRTECCVENFPASSKRSKGVDPIEKSLPPITASDPDRPHPPRREPHQTRKSPPPTPQPQAAAARPKAASRRR
jgi:hypothetical protein